MMVIARAAVIPVHLRLVFNPIVNRRWDTVCFVKTILVGEIFVPKSIAPNSTSCDMLEATKSKC